MLFEDVKKVIRGHISEIDALIIKENELWLAPDKETCKEFLEKIFQDKVLESYIPGRYKMKSLPGIDITFGEFTVTLKNLG